MDLFERAVANAEHISTLYSQIEDRPGVRTFVGIVSSQACVSMNHDPVVVIGILEEGQIFHSRDLAERLGLERDTLIERKHKYVSQKRLAFDRTFQGSDRFFYGALNLDTIGTDGKDGHFGEYCVVLDTQLFSRDGCEAACLKTDSLHDCYWERSTFREDLFLADLAPFPHRGLLAAIKLADQLAEAPPESYGRLLITKRASGRDEYVEVIFTIARLGVSEIASIRVNKARVLSLVATSGDLPLSEPTAHIPASDYGRISELCDRVGVRLEQVSQ